MRRMGIGQLPWDRPPLSPARPGGHKLRPTRARLWENAAMAESERRRACPCWKRRALRLRALPRRRCRGDVRAVLRSARDALLELPALGRNRPGRRPTWSAPGPEWRSGEIMPWAIADARQRPPDRHADAVSRCNVEQRRAEIGYSLSPGLPGPRRGRRSAAPGARPSPSTRSACAASRPTSTRATWPPAGCVERLGFQREGLLRARWQVAGEDLRHRAVRAACARNS